MTAHAPGEGAAAIDMKLGFLDGGFSASTTSAPTNTASVIIGMSVSS